MGKHNILLSSNNSGPSDWYSRPSQNQSIRIPKKLHSSNSMDRLGSFKDNFDCFYAGHLSSELMILHKNWKILQDDELAA